MEQYLNEFILIAIAHFIALLSPGADFIYLVNSSLNNTKKVAIGSSLGIALSNGFYIMLCLLGYATVFSQSSFLMGIIKLFGGIYLLYLGVIILKSSSTIKLIKQNKSSFIKEVINGFNISFFNPKISIFYISLFTLIINPNTPLFIQILYGLWMFLVVFLWDSMLVFLLSIETIKQKILSISYLQKLMGSLLLVLGISLFFSLFS